MITEADLDRARVAIDAADKGVTITEQRMRESWHDRAPEIIREAKRRADVARQRLDDLTRLRESQLAAVETREAAVSGIDLDRLERYVSDVRGSVVRAVKNAEAALRNVLEQAEAFNEAIGDVAHTLADYPLDDGTGADYLTGAGRDSVRLKGATWRRVSGEILLGRLAERLGVTRLRLAEPGADELLADIGLGHLGAPKPVRPIRPVVTREPPLSVGDEKPFLLR